MRIFTQLDPPAPESEKLDLQELAVLDKSSLTSVVDFMRKFQEDASFTPPTSNVTYDSEHYDLNIDSEDEFPSLYDDDESIPENARARD